MSLADPSTAAAKFVPGPGTHAPSAPRHQRFLAGLRGLSVGWRLLLFLTLLGTLLGGLILIANGGPAGVRRAHQQASHMTVTPLLLGSSELVTFLLLCLPTWVMGKIEDRPFGAYGLPWRRALGKDFWMGGLAGFSALSGTLFTIFLFHGFEITGRALQGTAILSSLASWAIAFLLVGLSEEFLFRGYLQYTLAAGIGFWPAAFLLSSLFAIGHAFNPRETFTGVASVMLFGLLLSLFLRRTGSLWCSVGFHAAYDWGQTFFGVSDSGIVPYHNFFASRFHGPAWLTGGTVGPEASLFTPFALAGVAVLFSLAYGGQHRQAAAPSARCGSGSPAAGGEKFAAVRTLGEAAKS
jgi:uncharacterized protein